MNLGSRCLKEKKNSNTCLVAAPGAAGPSAEGQATAGAIGGTLEVQARRWAGKVM